MAGTTQFISGVYASDHSQIVAGTVHGDVHFRTKENLISTLPTAKDAPFNAYQRQHDPTCLPDTRVDLLREIYDWADGDNSPGVFWLSGLAGTGKSTIAQTVAKEYHAKGRLAASFFFSRAGGDVSHAGKFITSIAVQLANYIPGLKCKICDAISNHSDIASQSLDDQWRELVLSPISRLENKDGQSRYVLVVDALDECDDQNNVQIILQHLAEVHSLQSTQLRVLLTSRPEVPIQYGFTQVRREEHRDFVLHDIKAAVVEHDITVFLRHQLGLVGQRCGFAAGWPEDQAIARLVQNSGGLFIWAATACRFIEEDGQLAEARLASLLNQGGKSTLPPERKLDEIYTTVLASAIRGERSEAESQVLHELFRQIVGPIVTLQDPLSVASLAGLLRKDVAALKRTLGNLHSVLDVPTDESNPVRLLHPSFRDFLLNPSRCSDARFHIDERLVHGEIYRHSLQMLWKHLQRDICRLQEPGARTADVSRADVDRYIQPYVQYACRFWVYHYRRSDTDRDNCHDVEVFLRKHFLHWLESLALLGRVSDAVNMVHTLDSMFSTKRIGPAQVQSRLRDRFKSTVLSRLSLQTNSPLGSLHGEAGSDLQALVHDAVRFVLAFRPILEEAPLQLYYAGLVFSPRASIIKEIYSQEAPAWLPCMPEVAENWSACLQTLKGHSRQVRAVAFSPDGKTLASASGNKTVKVWDAGSGKALQTLRGHSDGVNAVAFSPDGLTLASASGDKTVKLWDAGSGKALQTLRGHSGGVNAVAFSPDGKTLASASGDKTVKVWDTGSGKVLQTLKGHSDRVTAVAFSPDSKTLASASRDMTVKVWDAGSGKALQTLKGHSAVVSAVAFSPNGKTLASASWDDTVRAWDAGSGKALKTLKSHSDNVMAVAFSPNGKTLASASWDMTVKVWDAGSGKEALQTLKGHSDGVNAVAFSPDGLTLASASDDKTVKVWDAGSGKEALQTLKGHSGSVMTVAFSLDGKTLASASGDKTVKVWDVGSGKALQTLKGHSAVVSAVAFSPDGLTLASASRDKTVEVWDTGSGKALQTLKGHSDRVTAMAFSPDSKTLASASRDMTVKVWDAGSGKALQTLKGHSNWVMAVAFSPDGLTLASASDDKTVKVWDVGSGKALHTLKGHSGWVYAVAFSPDGKTLASASGDKTVKLWDAGSGKALQTLKGHSNWVTAVAFSPDGLTLASASWDDTVRAWDAGSGKALQTLKGHSDIVTAVAFSPDGKTLASASGDKTVEVWDAMSGKALQTLMGHSGSVIAVAFSPDSKTLASASRDMTVKVWDAMSGKALQTLNVDSAIRSLSFSNSGSDLQAETDRGVLVAGDKALSRPTSPQSMFVEEEWICWEGKRVLWLPSEYRSSVVAVHGSSVGFGYTSGQVLVLRFVF